MRYSSMGSELFSVCNTTVKDQEVENLVIMDDADYKNTRAHIDELIDEHKRKIENAKKKIDNENNIISFLGNIYSNAKI